MWLWGQGVREGSVVGEKVSEPMGALKASRTLDFTLNDKGASGGL